MSKFEQWLEEGTRNGWLRFGCAQHDLPFSGDELDKFDKAFNDGDDPCLPIVRLVEHPDAK